MIPKHRERSFKLLLAAFVRLEKEYRGVDMINTVLDIYKAFERAGMDTIIIGKDGLFASDAAFYQFTYDNADEIKDICNEILEKEMGSAKSAIDAILYEGETFLGRGQAGASDGLRRCDEEADRRLPNRERLDFIKRTLKTFFPNERNEQIAEAAKTIAAGIE